MKSQSTRERLPDVRRSITNKLVLCHARTPNKIDRVHFYIVIGLFPDGRPAELFITVNGGSEMLNGWCKCWAIAISLCLQSGVSAEKLYEKFAHQDFELKGFTENKDIRSCSSVCDYVMQFFKQQFMKDNTP
jgi:ribonucleoside-diphosphate reductase alpha chain